MSTFIRIDTNPRVFEHPLSFEPALVRVESGLDQPCTRIVRPTEGHWTVFQEMLKAGQAVTNPDPGVRLAALAVRQGVQVAFTDVDFARFPELK